MERERERERDTLPLTELSLICALCGGYYIDATSIVECFHTYCKSCIVKHITSDNVDINCKDTGKKRNVTDKFCPMCEVQLHKTKPLLSLRPDDRMQMLVYKAVPKLYEEEVKRRYRFYAERNLEDSPECERDMEAMFRYNIFYPTDMFSISLEYYNESKKCESVPDGSEKSDPNDVLRRYLRCPAPMTIHHLKKFLRMKFLLTVDHPVDIYYKGTKRKGLENKEDEVLQETYSLMDIAYIFEWDPKESHMKFGYQILKRQVVVKSANINRVMVAESSSSSPLKETVIHGSIDNISEDQNEQSGQMRDLRLGKKKLRENCDTISEGSPVPVKRLRRKSCVMDYKTENTEVIGVGSKPNLTRREEICESITVEDSNEALEVSLREEKGVGSQGASSRKTEESVVLEDDGVMETEDISQAAESIDQQETSQDIEEVVVDVDGEPSQDFILQEEQAMDASEELEEDDDEDRLRICDPEEISEDRVCEEYVEEKVEDIPVQADAEVEQIEHCVEEEAEVARKESRSRRKNKKAKHHHRHRRDYSPAPEATIVSSDDKTDSLKLKVKITRSDSETNQGKNRSKQDDSSRYYKLSGDGHNSPKLPKHKNYAISEGIYNNSEQSPSHSNNDEDSRNSHSTDDHEVRSIASSKEGHDEVPPIAKGNPLQNGNLDSSKINNRDISNKEKLNQLRQVRHKNITPPPPRALPNTTISKVSAEEASKNSLKTLTSNNNSIVTLKKVTAEEAEENKVMKTYNNLESKRPSLEIIPVVGDSNFSAINKTNEIKSLLQNKQKNLLGGNPVVKLMKNNHINSLIPNQNSTSFSKVKCTNVDISSNSEVFMNAKEGKIVAADKKPGIKKRENCGVLDLSEKSTRSSCSSPASEGSNSPSPHQPVLSASQPLINRHLAAMNSPHRSSSSSPPVTTSIPKGSPTRPMQHPSYLSDLMTLSDTAVHIRNIKAAQVQDGIRRQVSATQNKSSPQRYSSMPSPGKSPTRASPAQLKIPTPNLTSKFASRPKLPTNPTSLPNRPVAVNRPMAPSSRVVAGRTINIFPNMMSSHSAAVAKKQADINGRALNIPPPPPVIPISSLYKMEKMARKFDLEKIARAMSAESKAKAKGLPYIPKQVPSIQESTVSKIPSS